MVACPDETPHETLNNDKRHETMTIRNTYFATMTTILPNGKLADDETMLQSFPTYARALRCVEAFDRCQEESDYPMVYRFRVCRLDLYSDGFTPAAMQDLVEDLASCTQDNGCGIYDPSYVFNRVAWEVRENIDYVCGDYDLPCYLDSDPMNIDAVY